MEKITKELEKLTEAVKKMAEEVKGVKKSQELMSNKYDDLLKEYKSVKGLVSKLVNQSNKQDEKIKHLMQQVDKFEAEKIINEIEIVGLPENENEVVQKATLVHCQKLGLQLKPEQIIKAYRIGPNNPDRPRIVVAACD